MLRIALRFQKRRRPARITAVPVYQQVVPPVTPTRNQRIRLRPDLVREAVVASQVDQHRTAGRSPVGQFRFTAARHCRQQEEGQQTDLFIHFFFHHLIHILDCFESSLGKETKKAPKINEDIRGYKKIR